jgi:hypothetical protein
MPADAVAHLCTHWSTEAGSQWALKGQEQGRRPSAQNQLHIRQPSPNQCDQYG